MLTQKIQINKNVKKTIGEKPCKIIGEYVVVKIGKYKNNNDKYIKTTIANISKHGVYCANDEFYSWELF